MPDEPVPFESRSTAREGRAAIASCATTERPPIFIVGCPRSGTTLLAALFDRHSQVAVPAETHFFTQFRAQLPRVPKIFSAEKLAATFVSAQYTCDLGLDARALAARLGSKTVALPRFFDAAMQEFAATKGKAIWAEKTPEHVFCVKEILTWYPNARIVCIIRDGRDATMSMDALPWTITPSRGHAAIWRDSARHAERWSREFPEEFHTLRFEDLLADPHGVLTETMRHVGLPFEPGQLEASRTTSVVPAWEAKVKQNVFTDLDASRAYAWKHTASPKQVRIMNSMMNVQLQALGYTDCKVPSALSPIAIYDSIMNWAFTVLYGHRLEKARRFIRRMLPRLGPASPHTALKNSAKTAPALDEPLSQESGAR